MELKAKPRANPAVVQREAPEGEMVLINLDSAASIVLNSTGLLVWRLVDGRRTVKHILAVMRRQMPDAPRELAGDVVCLLEELAADGFIGFEWCENPRTKEETL